MSQASTEVQFQIRLNKANAGDPQAISELTNFAFQALQDNEDPQKIEFGLTLLKTLSNCGNKASKDALAEKINAVAIVRLREKPKLAFRLLSLARNLGNLDAKCNLAIYYFKGQGIKRQFDKAISLLKECYAAGRSSVLDNMNTMAKGFLYGEDGVIPDLQKAVELWTFAAQSGHVEALENLAVLGEWFYSGVPPCPQDISQGMAILKMTAQLGNKKALHNLGAVGFAMISTDPKVGFELLTLASELGDINAKRAVAEKPSILRAINIPTADVSAELREGKKDIEDKIKLLADTAQQEDLGAQHNLFVLAHRLFSGEKPETDGDTQQDILTGLRILHYLVKTFKNPAAEELLTHIRALKIPIPMPNVPESVPNFKCNDLIIGPSTPEEPHSPCTAEFLRKNNISVSADGVRIQGSTFAFSPEEISQFKTDRNTKKLEHFTGVLDALNQYFPSASVIQETVCGYIPDEVSPLFFQYRDALAALDKNPQLECLSVSVEETPSDSSVVKVHV